MPELTFRFAEERDCALILQFIKGLAEYEKMADQVIATETLLRTIGVGMSGLEPPKHRLLPLPRRGADG